MSGIAEATLRGLSGAVMTLTLLLSGCSGGSSQASDQASTIPPQETQNAAPPRPAQPKPTTENQPEPRRQCDQQVCLEIITFGDLARAWSISVNHASTASNLCAFLTMRCESDPFTSEESEKSSTRWSVAQEQCLRVVVEDACAHTNCQEEMPESDVAKCYRRLWVSTCPEMLANIHEFVACKELPAAACTMPRRDPYDPSRQNICEGVAEQLLDCGYPSAPDGCAYIESVTKHCMAQDFAPEKWEEVASCMDPEQIPDSDMVRITPCSDKLACIKRVAPVLIESAARSG